MLDHDEEELTPWERLEASRQAAVARPIRGLLLAAAAAGAVCGAVLDRCLYEPAPPPTVWVPDDLFRDEHRVVVSGPATHVYHDGKHVGVLSRSGK